MTRVRGICRVCKREWSVNVGGNMRLHRSAGRYVHRNVVLCAGSDQEPLRRWEVAE